MPLSKRRRMPTFFDTSKRAEALVGPMMVRAATVADVPRFVELVRELAAFEKMEGPGADAEQRLARDLAAGRFGLHLAEIDARIVAYAVTFETYSTFRAAPILYLEDLYVTPSARRRGVAHALMRHIAADALRRGCCRLSWVVLDWNVDAQRFYERLGAKRAADWWPYTLERPEMEALVGKALDDRDAS